MASALAACQPECSTKHGFPRARLFPLPLQNFCVILNQHNPSRDKAVHFLVTLKRPDQRNLELQRRVRIIQSKSPQAGMQWWQEASSAWGP